MPPRGVKKGSKRGRQYEHIKKSEKEAGRSTEKAEEIAARAVNKERARSGESERSSPSSKRVPRRAAAAASGPARARAAKPANSSTTTPRSWASKAARR
jgi:hypothetical protein